ncbi:type III toxin-antitoxin system ToxN/AbiQ family toxin [Bacillus sp. FSL W8-0183]|uniref:type III toxin-antitoxin system ToxN/AbiQ family toxin n=1 Tax=Bacillus sp. FSL W8-0183 TaxID=2954568 RepID=UPI0030F775EB
MTKIKIYEVEKAYVDYLRTFDNSVPEEKDFKGAKARKYIGILFEISSFKYFAPLSSPKKKFKTMKNGKDFMKIDGGQYGAINFNNMIPIHDLAIINYDIDRESDEKYKNLLKIQIRFIRKNREDIINTASELYRLMTSDSPEEENERERLAKRCCKYLVLEEACKKYGDK